MAQYAAAPGALYDDKAAQVIGRELERIESSAGAVTPDTVVEGSKDPASPLHEYFLWGKDKEAADSWRRDQARTIVNHLCIKVQRPDGTELITKARWSVIRVVDENGKEVTPGTHRDRTGEFPVMRCYATREEALSVPDERRQILSQALRELKGFRSKYGDLGFRELDKVMKTIDSLAG